MAAYGDNGPTGGYEYDHLVPLELGGATNDSRNLWPEPGASPNPKDVVEDELNREVCDGRMTLARAQLAIATDWVQLARGETQPPSRARKPARPQPEPPAAPTAWCSARAQYSSHYGDYDVYVHSNQPHKTVTITGAGTSASWHTDDSGYADVYLYAGRSAAGERANIRVGSASCYTTL